MENELFSGNLIPSGLLLSLLVITAV